MVKQNNRYIFSHFKALAFLMLFLFSFAVIAQKVRVQNKESKKGIEGVFVYNKDKSKTAVSDTSGAIDISFFSKRDTLVFSHQSYATFVIQKISIGNTISLTEQIVAMPTYEIVAEQEKNQALEVTSKIDKIDSKTK